MARRGGKKLYIIIPFDAIISREGDINIMERNRNKGLMALIVSIISLLAIMTVILTSVFCLRGAKGDVGPKGEVGARGEKGERGDPGTRGKDGSDGSYGIDGNSSYGCTMLPSSDGYVTYSMASGLVGSKVTFQVHSNDSGTKVLKEFSLYDAGQKTDIDLTKVVYDSTNDYWSYETTMIEGGYVAEAIFYAGTRENYFGGEGNKTLYTNGLFDGYGNLVKEGTVTTTSFSSGSGTEEDPYMIPQDSAETLLRNLDCSDGGNFKLEGNVTCSTSYIILDDAEDVTLDLGGHTLTATTGTISGSLLVGMGDTKLTLKNGTVTTDASYNGALYLSEQASVEAENVTFKSKTGFGFVTNGSSSKDTVGVFNNCTFEAGSFAVYIPAGDFEFNNCTFNGYVRINGGNISIKDSVVNFNTYVITMSGSNPTYNYFDTNKDGMFDDTETRNYMVNYARGGAGCMFDAITILYGASMEASEYPKPEIMLSNITFNIVNQDSIVSSYPTKTNGLRVISYAADETSTFDTSKIDFTSLKRGTNVNSFYMNLYRISLGTNVTTDEI